MFVGHNGKVVQMCPDRFQQMMVNIMIRIKKYICGHNDRFKQTCFYFMIDLKKYVLI